MRQTVENRKTNVDILMYNRKRIAVMLSLGGVPRVLCGLAAFEKDEQLGSIVKIRLQKDGSALPGDPAIVLQGDTATKRLVADDLYGYDFRLELH